MRWDGRKAAYDVCCLCGEDRRLRVHCGHNVALFSRDCDAFHYYARSLSESNFLVGAQQMRPPGFPSGLQIAPMLITSVA
jgi:hypothetical protein